MMIMVMIVVMIMMMIMVMIMVIMVMIMVHLLERLGVGATMAPGNSLSVTAVSKSSSIVTAGEKKNYFQTKNALLEFAVKLSSCASSSSSPIISTFLHSIITAKAIFLWISFAFGTIPSLLPFYSKYFQTEDAFFRFCS